MALYIGEVKNIDDYTDGERIKVRVLPADKDLTVEDLPYSFPLLPKMFHVKPNVGEAVLIICIDDDNQRSQRFYVGPIISQPQQMKHDNFVLGATTLLKNSLMKPKKAPSLNPNTKGCYGGDKDVAVYGRGDTDLILSEKSAKLRCGARKYKISGDEYEFNKKDPSFLALYEHNTPNINESNSTAILCSDDINLISNRGNPHFNTSDQENQVAEEEINKMIEKAHVLPYGDVLVDFLTMFLQMFKSHTHKYSNMPPCPDDCSKKLDMKYGTGTGELTETDYDYSRGTLKSRRFEDTSKTFKGLGEKLLSKHIRIN